MFQLSRVNMIGYEHPRRDGFVTLPRRNETPAPDRVERGIVELVEPAARADFDLVGIAGGIDEHAQDDPALMAQAARSVRIGGRGIVQVRRVEVRRNHGRGRRGGRSGCHGRGRRGGAIGCGAGAVGGGGASVTAATSGGVSGVGSARCDAGLDRQRPRQLLRLLDHGRRGCDQAHHDRYRLRQRRAHRLELQQQRNCRRVQQYGCTYPDRTARSIRRAIRFRSRSLERCC